MSIKSLQLKPTLCGPNIGCHLVRAPQTATTLVGNAFEKPVGNGCESRQRLFRL